MHASLTIRSRHDHHPPIHAPTPRKHLGDHGPGFAFRAGQPGRGVGQPPKTAAGRRVVVLPAVAVEELAKHLDDYAAAGPDGLVFPGGRDTYLQRSNFSRLVWRPAVQQLSLDGLRFHDLRHTAATLAAAAGATTKELMERMGHTSPAVACATSTSWPTARPPSPPRSTGWRATPSRPAAGGHVEGTTVHGGGAADGRQARDLRRRVERAKGIEPSPRAWEARVLPLNYARRSRDSSRPPELRQRTRGRMPPSSTLALGAFEVILSDRSLREAIDAGRLVVEPLDEDAIQPSSVDVRLDRRFRTFYTARHPYIDVRQPMDDLTELVEVKPDAAFILHPGEFVLGSTLERVGIPPDLAARLEGKSSLGRLGLMTHSTAGFLDPGFEGHVTLELSNVANLPITLYPGMRIGQIAVFQLTTPAERPYGSRGARSKYQGQRGPTPSRYWENFRAP
jgi:dCTP deaminase